MLGLSISFVKTREMGSFVPTMARSVRISRRKRKSLAGRPPVSWLDSPVSSTSCCCSIRRRKFCLCNQPPGERLDAALQLQQREGIRHQFEDDRMVFDLGPQPGNSRRENAAMIEDHAVARHRRRAGIRRAAPRLGDQPRLEQQFVALQNKFFVPRPAVEAESDGDAVGAILPHGGIGAADSAKARKAGRMTVSIIGGTPTRRSSQGR